MPLIDMVKGFQSKVKTMFQLGKVKENKVTLAKRQAMGMPGGKIKEERPMRVARRQDRILRRSKEHRKMMSYNKLISQSLSEIKELDEKTKRIENRFMMSPQLF